MSDKTFYSFIGVLSGGMIAVLAAIYWMPPDNSLLGFVVGSLLGWGGFFFGWQIGEWIQARTHE